MDSNLVMRKDILPCLSEIPQHNSSADTTDCSDGLQTLRSISKYLMKALKKGNDIKNMSLQLNENINGTDSFQNITMECDKLHGTISSLNIESGVDRNINNCITSSEMNYHRPSLTNSDFETSISSACESSKRESINLGIKKQRNTTATSVTDHSNKSNSSLTATESNKHKEKNSQTSVELESDFVSLLSENEESLSEPDISNNSKYPNQKITSCKESGVSLPPGVKCYCLMCCLSVPSVNAYFNEKNTNYETLNKVTQPSTKIKFNPIINMSPTSPVYKVFIKELPVNTRIGGVITWLHELHFNDIEAIIIQVKEEHCNAIVSFDNEVSCQDLISLKGVLFKGTPVKIKSYYMDNDGKKHYHKASKSKKRDNEEYKKNAQKKLKKHHTKEIG